MNCEDCGTKISNGMCPNCQEERFIFETQYEDMDEPISEEFMKKVVEQGNKDGRDDRHNAITR